MDAKSLGPIIQGWRIEADLTQQELGEKAGLSKRAVGNIERGNTAPTSQQIVDLCLALGREPADLLTISYRAVLDELNEIARQRKSLPAEDKGSRNASPGARVDQIIDQLAALMKELYRESRSEFQKVFFDWLAQPGGSVPSAPPPRTRKRVRRKQSARE